jgi:nitroreductase
MVRAYDPDRLVPQAVVTRLLELAVRAPSAGHSQGRDLLVLEAAQDRELFWAVSTPSRPAPARPGQAPPGSARSGGAWLTGMRTAPLLVVCFGDPDAYAARYTEPDKSTGREGTEAAAWPVPWWDVDTGMSALLLLLGSVDEGLGACFFGVPASRHAAVREAFGVPAGRRLVGVVSAGYRAPDHPSPSAGRPRRPLTDVAHRGRFGRPWQPT